MNSFSRFLVPAGLFICGLLAFIRPIWTGGVISTTDTLSHEYPWRGVIKPAPKLERYAHCDVTASWHPWKIFYHREFARGHYPFWAPDVACGYPIFAHSTPMGYSLPILLQYFLPCNTAINLGFFLQTWIGLAGMFCLLRNWRLSTTACFFGSIAFGLSYPVLEWEVAVSVSGAVVMLPWLILALAQYQKTGEIRFIGCAAMVCGIGILQGSIQSMIYLFLAVFAFAFAHWREQAPSSFLFGKWILALSLFTVLSVCLAAIALVPALQFFLFHNSRPRAVVDNWPEFLFLRPLVLSPLIVMGSLFPGLLGNAQSVDFKSIVNAIFGNMGFGGYWGSNQWSAYIGIAPLALACVAAKERRTHAHVHLALWLIFLPLGLMLWTPLYVITYTRGLSIAALGLAILAAIGFDLLSSRAAISSWLKRGLIALGVILLIGMCVISMERQNLTQFALKVAARQAEQGHQPIYLAADHEFQASKIDAFIANYSLGSPGLWTMILLCGATAVLLKARGNGWSAKNVQFCLLFLTLADLAALSWRTIPVVPVNSVYPPVPSLTFLKQQPGQFRVDSAWQAGKEIETARPNQLLPYGLETWGISESVMPPLPHRSNGEILPPEYCNARYLILAPQSAVPVDPKRFESVYEGPDAQIFLYRYALPRAFLFALQPEETAAHARQRLEQSSPESILSQNPGKVDVGYTNAEHIQLSFRAPHAALLVLLDRVYPGWNASVGGMTRGIEPVFGVMRSLEVHAGESQAQMVFDPVSWRAGALLSVMSMIIILTLQIKKSGASTSR